MPSENIIYFGDTARVPYGNRSRETLLQYARQDMRLLDLVYIGNWVLNSTRGDDRIRDYDQVESLVFSHCLDHGISKAARNGGYWTPRALRGGGCRGPAGHRRF